MEEYMATTVIDIDDEALEQARLYYGTATKKDTVNRALRDAAARRTEQLSALGRHLHAAVDEYEQMSDTEKAELRARMDTTDDKFHAQLTAVGVTSKKKRAR
jgi:Arc/MetJ family transcription regulator